MTELISGKGFKCSLPDGLPPLVAIRQKLADDALEDVSRAAREAVDNLRPGEKLSEGDRVLVAAGSRGISDAPAVIAAVCSCLREAGLQPTVIGAMGSHGGGTEQGQMEILKALGITPDSVGAPVITSDEAVVIGEDENGQPVYFDPIVFEYDGLLAVNRVKPHTTAHGAIQSGIIKMLVVGMGHHPGAQSFHQSAPDNLSQTLVSMYRVIREKTPLLGGVALVENAHKQSASVEGIEAAELVHREKQLLHRAEELMPKLPFDAADVLIVLEMGKDYSGTGMDTNVIGRRRIQGVPAPQKPRIGKIAVLDLTDASHGNACGVGLADFMTSRLARKVDLQATYLNVLTSRLTMRAMLPMIMQTDRDAVAAAFTTCGATESEQLRIAVITDTLHLGELWVSEALWQDIANRSDVHRSHKNQVELTFDESGELCLR